MSRTQCSCPLRIVACAALGAALAFAQCACAADQSVGVVAFANSGAAAAQKDFLTALALLHNFQYPEAAEAFKRAEAADPKFAMAFWGEAMSYNHAVWAQQDLAAARAALARLGPTPEARAVNAQTPREKAYLHAVEILYGDGEKFDRDRRYALAMETLHSTYPDDVDGTCFYALALLGTSHAGRDVPTYMRAAALMEAAFEQYPRHPGAAHYLIHSVDDSVHAPLGLRAALAYSMIAPDSPHALHMTSHIFLALGMWKETVEANEATVRLINQRFQAPNKNAPVPGCGHLWTWLSYGYLQQGRFTDARRMVERCGEELRSRPQTATGPDLLDPDATSTGSYSAMRTRYLVDSGDWSSAVATTTFDPTGVIVAEFSRDFADAYRAVHTGATEAAIAAVNRAKHSSERIRAAAVDAGIPDEHPLRQVATIEQDELAGLLLLRQGDTDGAIIRLSKAAAAEKAMPMEFGPPSADKPANELLGEVLLELGRAQEARTAFDVAQVMAPGRGQSLIGLAKCARALHDPELAEIVEARLANVGLRASLDANRK